MLFTTTCAGPPGYSYFDSLIIASSFEYNCPILYTEDMQHNQIIENRLRLINPFH